MPQPDPPVQLVELLTLHKTRGRDFDSAWTLAWQRVRWPHDTAHRRSYKTALEETRAAWQEAYEDRPNESAGSLRILLDVLMRDA